MTMLAITSEVLYKEVYRRIYTAMANWHYLRANIYMPILHNYAYNCIFNVSYIILYILGFGTNALASTHYYSCFFICGY
jgi:hypothetical protein